MLPAQVAALPSLLEIAPQHTLQSAGRMAVNTTSIGASQDATLEERIAAVRPDLSPAEERVAGFFAQHREEVMFLSAVEIAGRLDTSDATVIRAAQSLGYSGLPALKAELREAMRTRATPTLRLGRSLEDLGSDPAAVLEHVLATEIELLHDARETLRAAEFTRALELIAGSQRVVIQGLGPNAPLAEYFASRLCRMRRAALSVGARGQANAVLYEGGRLIIGDGTVIDSGAFVVENGRIGALGPKGAVTLPAGAARVDLTGKTVMPSMINAHVHIGYEGYTSWGAQNYTPQNVQNHLEREAFYGVGATVSVGSSPTDQSIRFQQDQQAGKRSEGAGDICPAARGVQCEGSEHHAEPYRHQHEVGAPSDVAGHHQCRHAKVVHAHCQGRVGHLADVGYEISSLAVFDDFRQSSRRKRDHRGTRGQRFHRHQRACFLHSTRYQQAFGLQQ